jgi:dTDP-4-amino-4,6-dideoxygalactose transaminase
MIKYASPNIKITKEISDKISSILRSGQVSIGPYVDKLQNYFRNKCGVKHALACSSATTGLIIAVKSAGWKDKYIGLPAFTWPSTLYALECNNNTGIFFDIDKETWVIDCDDYRCNYNAIAVVCEGLIIVDTFGLEAPRDIPWLPAIYDAAHGFGLPNLGKRGLAEVVSFSFTKNVTGTEGGMILTDDDDLADTAKELIRMSGRMSEINALIAFESIKTYYGFQEFTHESNILSYQEHLHLPYTLQKNISTHNNSVFAVKFESQHIRDIIKTSLSDNGIETKVYYEPLSEGLPVTDDLYSKILSLPIHCNTSDIVHICHIINNAIHSANANEEMK